MNQILVTEKLYVTPELKRKKKIYKFNFIISVVVIVILCSFYVHSEYARNKETEISEEILAGLIEEQGITEEEQQIADQENDGVWKILVSSVQQQQQEQQTTTQMQDQGQEQIQGQQSITNQTNKNPLTTTNKKKTKTYITVKGKRYPSIGRIRIPKINVDQAILAEASGDTLVDWLKISPCKFWGPDLNEIGNVSIAGHNYRNTKFFSKVPTLEKGDKIKITDLSNKTITYKVFNKYTVSPKNTDCINPVEGKENKRVITLITCTNDTKKRVIVQAEEI